MQLSKETLEILKNYASLNPSVMLSPGNVIKTITPQKNVMAIAKIAETIPVEAPIFDLNQFLGTISLFDQPDLDFRSNYVFITDASGSEASFVYAARDTFIHPEQDVKFPTPEVVFALEEKPLTQGLKAAAVMGLPSISFVGENGDVYIAARNSKDASSNSWRYKVGSCSNEFELNFRLDLFRLLPRDYEVSISSKLLAQFESKKGDVTYFTAAESGSSFK